MNKKETPNYAVIPDMAPGSSPFIRKHNFYKNLDCVSTPAMTTKTKAFTLIELLVVVLIIGILAAIALPQYQKAVKRAKFTKLVISLNAIVKAQKVYFMANNSYANDLSDLDIQVPTVSGVFCTAFDGSKYANCYFANNSGTTAILQENLNTGYRQCCSYPSTNFEGDSFCSVEMGTTSWTNNCSQKTPCHCYSRS